MTVEPVRELPVTPPQLGMLENGKFAIHLVNDTDLEAILQISADAAQCDIDLDLVPGQFPGVADSRQHQELRRVEGPSGENDFAPGVDLPHRRGGRSGAVYVGAIKILSVHKFDADRTIALQKNPRRESVQFYRQLFWHPPVGIVDELTRSGALAILYRERHEDRPFGAGR